MRSPDVVTLADFEYAAQILKERSEDALPIGRSWLGRAYEHLIEKVDRYFRDRPKLSTEKIALAEIRKAGLLLQESSDILRQAAARLKAKGDPHGASLTMQAALRFSGEARNLTGEDA